MTSPALAYSLTDITDEADSRHGMTNYHIDWPGGWTTDCVARNRATAAQWAAHDIAEAGFDAVEREA